MITLQTIIDALEGGKRFLLALHQVPDGDSIGASLALALALRHRGKKAQVVSPDPIGTSFQFLPGVDEIVSWPDVEGESPFDAVIFLDCADEQRAGAPRAVSSYGRQVINVDHHTTNGGYGDLVFIDPSAAAVAEVAARLIERLGVVLDLPIALCLYTALVTDTGGFRYSSTTVATHRLAARLLDTGIDPGEVSEAIYEHQSLASYRLLSRALAKLTTVAGGKIAYMTLTKEDFDLEGVTPLDVDSLGIVNYARSIAGVEAGFLVREENGAAKCSLRSKAKVDVAKVAQALGGGGHARAAGVTLQGTVENAAAILIDRLTKEL